MGKSRHHFVSDKLYIRICHMCTYQCELMHVAFTWSFWWIVCLHDDFYAL